MCENISSALRLTKLVNFENIGALTNPSIQDLLERLRVFDDVVSLLLDHASVFDLDYSHTRMLLNCKQLVNNMERLANAIQAGNQADYDAAVSALEKEAPF